MIGLAVPYDHCDGNSVESTRAMSEAVNNSTTIAAGSGSSALADAPAERGGRLRIGRLPHPRRGGFASAVTLGRYRMGLGGAGRAAGRGRGKRLWSWPLGCCSGLFRVTNLSGGKSPVQSLSAG
jgi:hypothetical protein